MTPDEFVKETIGKPWDIDHAYSTQCWDLFARFCQDADIPLGVIHCGVTGYVIDIWNTRKTSGILNYFDEVHEYRDGDWLIYPESYYMTPKSHVAMVAGDLSFDQTTKRGCAGYSTLDFSQALGGFRWKGWSSMDNFRYGLNYRTFDGADLVVYKGYEGYDLYIISAGEGELKDIRDFDSDELLLTAAVNAGYFQLRSDVPDQPYGMHFGVEQSINGVDLAPKKEGLLAFYETYNDGVQWCTSDKYWYSGEEVRFGITPYSVIRYDNKSLTGVISTDYGSKELTANQQTMIARVNGTWFFVESRNPVLPSVMLRYAEVIGAEIAVLMDSGGSTQMMAYDAATGSYEPVIYTGRKIPNVAVIAKKKDHPEADSEPVEDDPQEGGEDTMPNDEVPVDEQDEMQEEIPAVPGMSSETFDRLRYCAELLLPGIATLIVTLGMIFGWDVAEKIGAAVMAFSTFLGSVVISKRKEYNARNGDGA